MDWSLSPRSSDAERMEEKQTCRDEVCRSSIAHGMFKCALTFVLSQYHSLQPPKVPNTVSSVPV
ncbi:hypothetical protein PISMIDRAFT_676996 [Pisolithus microcarpus 441]|uniref:Uncharacterized protein n=1 Tax=Pisolithus microcarpus 441 TaxID=765257 RepID=A0A0C9ZI68_9AGAM|nr:hypothetical protein PISMIDRAFT_676996 [Pisolithus microcarpus 441]